jgi:crotonobetainyl-CoA:carnitine CoA-transferase CaiB-like acyl-CoA transferase
VEELVRTAARAHGYDDLAGRLRASGLGFDEVKAPGAVLSHDQAQVPGKLVQVDFGGHRLELPTLPILGAGSLPGRDPTPPALGEATVELLKSVG